MDEVDEEVQRRLNAHFCTEHMKKEAEDRKPIMPKVMADLAERYAFGLQKYGKPVKPYDGEDYLQHLYEELLDACVYIKSAIEEQRIRRGY